ncbi:MAG: cytoplasmic protein [Chloroflexi bacterium HGW-Chloroflexi-6]|nr:MAG: cytoplasmic protein [Chloroflexi bacterium HGW-Chloroflexi-6]
MTRPLLNSRLSAEAFLRYYWLKEELSAFCRDCGLSTSGSKQTLTERIANYLETGDNVGSTPAVRKGPKSQMPATFTRTTVIGPGWRCSQGLRAFFEQEIGRSFHFDATLRDFIHHGQGKTLQEAILVWEAAQRSPLETEIAPQFEYNRHIREYLKANPGAGLKAAIRAWNELKQHPKE